MHAFAGKIASSVIDNALVRMRRPVGIRHSVKVCADKKKASFCNEALKGSLNLMVSKGPEETTGKYKLK